MRAPTKQEIIEYLKHDRTLIGGKILYNRFPAKSLALIQMFNTMSNTPQNIARICYELGRLIGLSERETIIYTQNPVTEKPLPQTPIVIGIGVGGGPLTDELLSFDPETAEYHQEIKTIAKKLETERSVVFADQKKETLVFGIMEAAKEERSKLLEQVPDKIKKTIKLRDQFPFLAEEDCPAVYKELVSDMITAYHKYTEAHSQLFSKTTQGELMEIADTVKDNFLENKEIWEELEYYQKNKSSLGKHAVFLDIKFRQAMEELPTEELSKAISNLKNKINRNKKKAEDIKKSEADREKSTKLYQRQQEELKIAEEIFKTR